MHVFNVALVWQIVHRIVSLKENHSRFRQNIASIVETVLRTALWKLLYDWIENDESDCD